MICLGEPRGPPRFRAPPRPPTRLLVTRFVVPKPGDRLDPRTNLFRRWDFATPGRVAIGNVEEKSGPVEKFRQRSTAGAKYRDTVEHGFGRDSSERLLPERRHQQQVAYAIEVAGIGCVAHDMEIRHSAEVETGLFQPAHARSAFHEQNRDVGADLVELLGDPRKHEDALVRVRVDERDVALVA